MALVAHHILSERVYHNKAKFITNQNTCLNSYIYCWKIHGKNNILKVREDEGKRDNSHICLISYLFLETVPSSSAFIVTTHVGWMLAWRMEMSVMSLALFARAKFVSQDWLFIFSIIFIYLTNYHFIQSSIYLITY